LKTKGEGRRPYYLRLEEPSAISKGGKRERRNPKKRRTAALLSIQKKRGKPDLSENKEGPEGEAGEKKI